MHHQVEAVLGRPLELLRVEHPLEQHDGLSDAGAAQHDPLLQARHAERVGGGQRARRRHQPVPVGVGLDHRHHPGAAGARTDAAEVVLQGVGIDDGADVAAHRHTPSA